MMKIISTFLLTLRRRQYQIDDLGRSEDPVRGVSTLKKIFLITLLIVIAIPCSTYAQIDPDPDGMSIYFDLEAMCFMVHTIPGAYSPITAFLMVTNPSTPHPKITGWEAHLEVDGNPGLPIPNRWTILGSDGVDVTTGNDYIQTVDLPIMGSVTILAHITVSFIGYEVNPTCTFTMGGVPGSTTFTEGPGYIAAPGDPIPAIAIFGSWDIETAWINGMDEGCSPIPNPFPVEVMTWGAVKSLYNK